MKTVATVVAVKGRLATVETVRLSACEGCHKKADGGECSVCSLLGGEQKMRAEALNPCHAGVGDTVSVESETGKLLRYAALLFLLPIALCFAGYGLSSLASLGEAASAAAGIAGFAVGVLIGVLVSKRKKGSSDIVITEVLMKGKP